MDLFYKSAQIRAHRLANDQREMLQVELDFDLPEDVELFRFIAEMSNNSVDAYYTHMSESTLKNFASDASTGVSFLDSHDSRKLGLGQTFNGQFVSDGERLRALTGVYIVPDIAFGGNHSFATTDDFIRAVRTKMVRDVSVGFYGGSITCDLCGDAVWGNTNCVHFPGTEYAIGDQGNETVTATAEIDGAHLAELSAVYDGATPGAMILKFERGLSEGWIDRSQTEMLERRYKVQLPDDHKRKIWPTNSEVNMDNEGQTTERQLSRDEEKALKNASRALETLLEVDGVEGAVHEAAGVVVDRFNEQSERIKGLETELAKANARVAELTPMADDGKAYREQLVSDTLAEGVRANGEDFAEETYRKMLESADLNTVRQMRDDWKKLGDSRFAAGRQTVDETETNNEDQSQESSNDTPDEAYIV